MPKRSVLSATALTFAALLALCCAPAGAQPPADRVDALLQKYQEYGLFNGSVASGHRMEAVQQYERAIALSETPRRLLIYQTAIRELSAPESKAAK